MTEHFDHTAPALATVAGCSAPYVIRLAKSGLIKYIQATDGTWLFQRRSAPLVKRIKKERLANRHHAMHLARYGRTFH